MAKRFNYKQFEMQMEDLKQEAMALVSKDKLNKLCDSVTYIETRGSFFKICFSSVAIFDEVDAKAIHDGFTVNTWIGNCMYIQGGVLPDGSDMIRSIEELRDAIAGFIRNFRNMPDQIRWMERRILESSVIDNGITTKTRRL